MVQYAKEHWTLLKTETNERLTKNRILKRWAPNDIILSRTDYRSLTTLALYKLKNSTHHHIW